MLKNTTYKEKFQMLNDWLDDIIETVKRDLRNEHLKKDWNFAKKYFVGKNSNKLTTGDLVTAYRSAIADEENGEEIGEFIAARWLLKHTEIYQFFEEKLRGISTDFSTLTEIDDNQAEAIMNEAVTRFGASRTYLFCVINSVVFPERIYAELRKKAKDQGDQEAVQAEEAKEQLVFDDLKKVHDREVLRLTDKYEKKLLGMQKKYLLDMEGFKKQIAHLQRKLLEKE
jgi:hypothetical protein